MLKSLRFKAKRMSTKGEFTHNKEMVHNHYLHEFEPLACRASLVELELLEV